MYEKEAWGNIKIEAYRAYGKNDIQIQTMINYSKGNW